MIGAFGQHPGFKLVVGGGNGSRYPGKLKNATLERLSKSPGNPSGASVTNWFRWMVTLQGQLTD